MSLRQKIALAFSLCLTVFLIVITVVQLSGLVYNGVIDSVWEFYWQLVGADVAIFMASAISFRSFFVARNNKKSNASPQDGAGRFFNESFLRKFHRKGSSTLIESTIDLSKLPTIPGGQLTGMGSFIHNQGESLNDTVKDDGVLDWPLPNYPPYSSA